MLDTYRGKIVDREIGNWSRDSEVVMGSLINGGVSDDVVDN
jgi:hypothetical protein